MPPPQRPNPRKVLLVEGNEDQQVVYHLTNHALIPRDSISVVDKKGYEKLLGTIAEEIDASEIEQLGILIDADTDVIQRWQSIRSQLQQNGYQTLPGEPNEAGVIVSEPGRPRLGIWIMPNNKLPGILEDFVSILVSPTDDLWQKALTVVAEIPTYQRRFTDRDVSKATIHTWLAWQSEPGTPLGLAITRKYLDANNIHAQNFLNWLRRLFNL